MNCAGSGTFSLEPEPEPHKIYAALESCVAVPEPRGNVLLMKPELDAALASVPTSRVSALMFAINRHSKWKYILNNFNFYQFSHFDNLNLSKPEESISLKLVSIFDNF
jgi:hypothetical protein